MAKAKFILEKLSEAKADALKGLEMDPNNELLTSLLKEIEQEMQSSADHPEKQQFQALFDAMKAKGATFEKLKLSYFSKNYRGVEAKADIKTGEEVMTVPESTFITFDVAFQVPVNKYIIDNKKDLPASLKDKNVSLALWLLNQQSNPEAQHKEFLDILPTDVNEFPVMFNNDELEALSGTQLLTAATELKKAVLEKYDALMEKVPLFKAMNITAEKFCTTFILC